MSAFDDLDAMVLDTALALFGDRFVTLYPMKEGPAGLNGPKVADDDPARPILSDVPAIRSEWAERVQIGGQGMPTPAGAFRLSAAGTRHVVTLKLADLGWRPVPGDELAYADRPGERYRLTELQPDGLSGLHIVLSRL